MLRDVVSPRSSAALSVYTFGPHRLDLAGRTLATNGEMAALTPKAFDLLVALVEHRDRVLSKDELMRLVWLDTFVSDDSLTQQISTLRKALGETAHDQQFIATFPRRGYRFVAEVVTNRHGPPNDVVGSDADEKRTRVRGFGPRSALFLYLGIVASLILWFAVTHREPGTSSGTAKPPVRLTTAGGMVTMPAISKDGAMIAYAAAAPGESHYDVWVQQTAGGQPLRLTTDPRDDLYPAFSPDGVTIAFQRPQGAAVAAHRTGSLGSTSIYLVPTLGGEPRLFVPGAGGAWPSFSPDGRWLAYVQGRGVAANGLFVAPVAGGVPKRLAKDLAMVDRFVWSPDSAYLLALGHRERWPPFQNDWFLAPADGGAVIEAGARTALVDTGAASTGLGEGVRSFPKPLAWHPEGNRVVFHMPQGDTKNLWQARIDPVGRRIVGPPERVTHGTNDEELASISGAGRMVYTSYDFRVDLWSVALGADGVSPAGPLQQLTNDVVDDFNPDVSKDGRYVTYASRRRGQDFAVVIRDLISGRERASGTFSGMPGPLFNADGRRIAYSIRRPGGGALFIEDLETGSVEQVCDACGVATQWHPAMGLAIGSLWSQDGLTLLPSPDPRVRTLLRSPGLYLFVPSFSPDGKWLTFSVAAEDADAFLPRIVVAPVRNGVPAAREEWVTVAEGHQLGRWSSKGDALFFWTACDGMPCICAQRLDDATKRPVGARVEIVRLFERTPSPRDLEPSNGFAVGPSSIVFPLGSKHGNLWMTDLPRMGKE